MAWCEVSKGDDGKYYIRPLAARLNGVSFKTKADAEYIVDAVNAAYNRGKEDVKSAMRDLLNVAERDDF
jgi:hypothetical protein